MINNIARSLELKWVDQKAHGDEVPSVLAIRPVVIIGAPSHFVLSSHIKQASGVLNSFSRSQSRFLFRGSSC
jgi:hypothetical protein